MWMQKAGRWYTWLQRTKYSCNGCKYPKSCINGCKNTNVNYVFKILYVTAKRYIKCSERPKSLIELQLVKTDVQMTKNAKFVFSNWMLYYLIHRTILFELLIHLPGTRNTKLIKNQPIQQIYCICILK